MRLYKVKYCVSADHPMNKDEVEYNGETFMNLEEYTKFCDLLKVEGITDIVAIPIYTDNAEKTFTRIVKNLKNDWSF